MSIAATVLIAGVTLITGNLTWFVVDIDQGTIEVPGQAAAPPLSGLALASVALAGALALAPHALRVVLGVVQATLGVLTVVSVLPAIADPEGRAAARVTEATGIDGDESVRAAIVAATTTPWPYVALVAAALGVLLGVIIAFTSRRWPAPGRRYASTAAHGAPPVERRSEDEWDALSRGDDPTS